MGGLWPAPTGSVSADDHSRVSLPAVRVSVVIPTYNRLATLRRTLQALAQQTHGDYEVIVVDDGSTDGTADVVPVEFPGVAYMRQANRGPAAARNRGIEAARGEVVAFTDDDCLPPADWLERLAEGLERLPQVVGAGGAQLAPGEVRAHNRLARYEAYVTRQVYGAADQEVVAGFECPAGGTNNMAYRRVELDRIGRFDESFPYAAGEDADLKLRLAKAGHRFAYLPVVVTHLQPYTWAAFRRQQYVRGKGRAYFDHKWKKPRGYLVVMLRAVAGLVRLPQRWLTMPEAGLLVPAVVELWCNTLGQVVATSELARKDRPASKHG